MYQHPEGHAGRLSILVELCFAWGLVLCVTASATAAPEPLRADAVPAPLAPWLAWALDGAPDPACPWVAAGGVRECVWPGRLLLEVQADGARFEQQVDTWSPSLVPLPGRAGQWPQDVRVDDEPAVVIEHEGMPALRLAAGVHHIAGRFEWSAPPESLRVPPAVGLLELVRDGRAVPHPQRAPGGELWLQTTPGEAAQTERDTLRLQVFRRVTDEVPLQVETLLDFDVAGTQREVTFANALPAAAQPMRIDASLPTRLDPDGRLRVQVRPGHWTVRVLTRQPGPVGELARPAGDAQWPAEEVWVFDSRPTLRVVDVAAGTPVDPRQTSLPEDWQALPAFRLAAGDAMRFTTQRRGDPEPAPDRLELERELWLDFDGGGYTVRDTISGTLSRSSRIDAGDALQPGRVLLDDAAQFITEFDGRRGVEVRRGTLDLRADSRIEVPTALNAVGWAQDFDRVGATLHLPPGWQLWTTRGVDRASDTWLLRWTLLDLFIVFIVALAVGRLWSWPLGGLALLTLVLCWDEPGAPQQVWLHVLAAAALVHVLPSGRLRALALAWRNVALLALLVLSVGFAISQLRVGLFPQLAQPWRMSVDLAGARPVQASIEGFAGAVQERSESSRNYPSASPVAPKSAPRYDVQAAFDPSATIQTGPGLPAWQWRQVRLDWSGPVTAQQSLDLVLLSPRVNLLLALARVASLFALLALLVRAALAGGGWRRGAALTTLLLASGTTQAALPDDALLETLRERLLRAPTCAPACVTLPRLFAQLADGQLQLRLELHVAAALAVPLPGRAEQWLPAQVIVDGAPSNALTRGADGGLLLALPAGVHQVVLAGRAPQRTSFQLALPVPAQQARVAAEGWAVDGLGTEGARAEQLIFTRRQVEGVAVAGEEQAPALPPFFTLERRLELGLEWRVRYRLERVTPPGVGATLAIPLLDGEAVTTEGLRVEGGYAHLDLGPGEHVREWQSVLDRRPQIELRAPDSLAWSETWRLDLSPIWHATLGGIPVVHHQRDDGQWLPTWRPWPGEAVSIAVSRPAGVPGRTLTIERSELRFAPGQRATDASLDLTLRSSQGGRHAIELPADAVLQAVTIDGGTQPIRQDGRSVVLPVVPGEQQVNLQWRSESSLGARYRTPALALGADSVNARLSLALPADRWVLFTGGPQLGPAVLFWGTLIVVALAAVVLGRMRIAPVPTWQWLLLGVGLTQSSVLGAVTVVGWLLALGLRARLPADLPRWQFNLAQFALAALTLVALGVLFDAITQGLLGEPSMQIAGNGSTATDLQWFVDRAPMAYPQAWVWSVSIWWYRALMLAWALWLAFSLLGWLRWGWRHYARDGVWRSFQLFTRKAAKADTP